VQIGVPFPGGRPLRAVLPRGGLPGDLARPGEGRGPRGAVFAGRNGDRHACDGRYRPRVLDRLRGSLPVPEEPPEATPQTGGVRPSASAPSTVLQRTSESTHRRENRVAGADGCVEGEESGSDAGGATSVSPHVTTWRVSRGSSRGPGTGLINQRTKPMSVAPGEGRGDTHHSHNFQTPPFCLTATFHAPETIKRSLWIKSGSIDHFYSVNLGENRRFFPIRSKSGG